MVRGITHTVHGIFLNNDWTFYIYYADYTSVERMATKLFKTTVRYGQRGVTWGKLICMGIGTY